MGQIIKGYNQNDYYKGLMNLLPNGKAWPKNQKSVMGDLIYCYASMFSQTDDILTGSIDEVFPATTTQLIEEWQKTLGLPDKCVSNDSSIESKRSQVIARLTATGSISNSYYINYAKQLGFDIDIIEYGGIISGIYRCGDSTGTCDSREYEFDITINVKNTSDYSLLVCEFQDIMPAMIRVWYVNN